MSSNPSDGDYQEPARVSVVKEREAVKSEGRVVVTLRAGKGYEAPWIVIHADSVDEAHGVFDDKRFVELMSRTQKAAQYFMGESGKA